MHQRRVQEHLTTIKQAATEAELALQTESKAPRERVSRAGWLPQSIYLPGELRKWLRLRAVTEEREIGEIVAEALQEYRARRGI